jgi:hypothetical protein
MKSTGQRKKRSVMELIDREEAIRVVQNHVSKYDDHYMHCLTRCIPNALRSLPSVTQADQEPQDGEPTRPCWASTTKELCVNQKACDDRGCQLYATDFPFAVGTARPSKPFVTGEEPSEYQAFLRRLSKVTDPQFQKELPQVVRDGFVNLQLPEIQ